jgi:hypothetical protein
MAINGFTTPANSALSNIAIKCNAQGFITISLLFALVYICIKLANNIVVTKSGAVEVDGR